jgi:hypothetical protein
MDLGTSSTTTGMGAGTTCQDDRDPQVPTLSDGWFCGNRNGRQVFSFVNLVDRHIGSILSGNNFGIVGSSASPFPHNRLPLLHTFNASTLEDPTNLTTLHGRWIGFDLSDVIAHSFDVHAVVGVYDQPTRRWTSTHSPSSLGSSHTLSAQPTTTDPSGIRN